MPIHREKEVTGYEQMVVRLHELWQQGHRDLQIAEQLTAEGFHSARSPHVTADSVMKIRLAHQWYLPFERMRRVEEVEGQWTARGLVRHLGINGCTVYRFIYRQVIPPEYVTYEPQSGMYLIRNDPQLLERLR